MTRKDFEALARILHQHRKDLQVGNNLAFDMLVSNVRIYCRSRSPSFDGDRFTRAVYFYVED